MGLFFQVLASGSKGNCVAVASETTRILLDAGLNAREILRRLDRTPVAPRGLSGILISHEHRDHCSAAGVLSRRFGLPLYMSAGTREGLPPQVGHCPEVRIFSPGTPFRVGDLLVSPFATSHDAREPSGFVIEHGDVRLGVCTDCGCVTQLVRARLAGCHALVLESNHDADMLMNGPYPWHLKQRIRGRQGHLSNPESLSLLAELHHERLRVVVMAHLSEVNNTPRLVAEGCAGLREDDRWADVRFHVASQHEVTPGETVEAP